jgi:putative ABC transport system permease protein
MPPIIIAVPTFVSSIASKECTQAGTLTLTKSSPIIRQLQDSMTDLRLALRSLVSTPVVSIVAALSLALGIGANTAIFSLVNSLVLRSLPVKEPRQLAIVTDGTVMSNGIGRRSWTNPIWEQMRSHRDLYDGLFAWSNQRFNLAAGGETQYVEGVWASGGMFDTLGVPTVLGRTFTNADDVRGGGPDGAVAVISYGFWQRRYGGAANAIGQRLDLDRVAFTIVGVTGPDFFGPEVGRAFDVAVPIGTEPLFRGKESWLDRRSTWWLTVMARSKPGRTIEMDTAALRGVQPQIRDATIPPDWPVKDVARYLTEPLTLVRAGAGNSALQRGYERPLVTLLAVVGLVLLIACANIANLLLARATARRHEWSVRVALGASRWRLARQLLCESLVLALGGAVAGIAIASWASRLLVAQLSTQTNPVFLDLSLDWRVLAFTSAVAMTAALLFGTAPALRAAGAAPSDALKEHGRGSSSGSHVDLAGGLVVTQVALSLILVVAASLFMRTFGSLTNLHLGFDRDRVLLVTVNAQQTEIAPASRVNTYERVRGHVLEVPGVASAAVSFVTPVSGSVWDNRVDVSGSVDLPERERQSNFNAITSGWFSTFGTPVITGRDVEDRDRKGAPPVVIVNQAFARRFLNGANPIGHTVTIGSGGPFSEAPREIVGLVADAVYRSLREPVPPTMYIPLAQYNDSRFPAPASVSISVRSASGSPALLTRSIAAAVASVNPDIALTFRLLADQVDASLTQERLVAILAGFFGALALLLAGLGLYGVTSYAVSRRRIEIGIRMALGAAPGGVVRLVLSRVTLLVAIGVILGAGVSVWASQFVATLLYGLEPRDPATLIGSAVVLAAVGGLAGWLPARRASRLDPAEVLRDS